MQFNSEGDIIDALHDARTGYDGVVINPGAYAHYSYAIADAIASIDIPVVEAHLRYKALARYDDLLQVEVRVTAAEKVRLNFAYRITQQAGDLVLEGETLHVCMNLEEKLKRLPEELVSALKPHLRHETPA